MATAGDNEDAAAHTHEPPATRSSYWDDNGDASSDEDDDDAARALFQLHDLAEQGALAALEALLPRDHHFSSEEPDSGGALRQRLAAESALLEKDDMGCLPVHVAVIHQHAACALHLLRHSAALATAMLRLKCGDLGTPFVHLVLRAGALDAAFATHMVAQLFTEESWSDDVKALLLEKLAAKDEEGNTVFHLCAMYDLSECLDAFAAFYTRQLEQPQPPGCKLPSVKSLLEKGNRVGFRPLHAAMKFQSARVARQLVEDFNVNVNSVSSLQQTPGHVAALAGFAEGIVLLQRQNPSRADWALEDSYGHTALVLAQKAQFAHVVRLLSGAGSSAAESDARTADVTTTTKFFFHPEYLRHLPMAYHRRGGAESPPENPERIDTLVDPVFGILRSREFVKDHVVWDYEIEPADIGDVLRVHEYHYVDKIRRSCEQLAASVSPSENDADDDDGDKLECGKLFALDPDTALSLRSYDAATRAAGAVCKAVDQVLSGECTNAFCIVRPPGHHAGPVGKVVCENDPEGSHGFCLFNNVAVGAAYARSHYKKHGVHKIAILDFDVHHGNGTEEIVRQLVPHTQELRFETPYGEGKQVVHQYKPWRSADDAENVFFCSVHGYGHKDPENEHLHTAQAAWFYPGSGESEVKQAPLIWNVGLEFCRDGASASRLKWRSAFRDEILPKLREFSPDLIFLSAGFDAHKKDNMNYGYVSLLEQDYEWLVGHVKQVANTCCSGRLISVLEGGYNFHGRMVSPFARSVAAHARALIHPSKEQWDESEIAKEAAHERALLANYSASSAPEASGEASESVDDGGVHALSVLGTKKRSDAAAAVPMAISRSKRARKDVDYVALAEEMKKGEE